MAWRSTWAASAASRPRRRHCSISARSSSSGGRRGGFWVPWRYSSSRAAACSHRPAARQSSRMAPHRRPAVAHWPKIPWPMAGCRASSAVTARISPPSASSTTASVSSGANSPSCRAGARACKSWLHSSSACPGFPSAAAHFTRSFGSQGVPATACCIPCGSHTWAVASHSPRRTGTANHRYACPSCAGSASKGSHFPFSSGLILPLLASRFPLPCGAGPLRRRANAGGPPNAGPRPAGRRATAPACRSAGASPFCGPGNGW